MLSYILYSYCIDFYVSLYRMEVTIFQSNVLQFKLLSSFCPYPPRLPSPLFFLRAAPATQEVVCSPGQRWISPCPPPLGDRWLGLIPPEVLHPPGQRAALRRLEHTHWWHPLQRDHLDRWQVHVWPYVTTPPYMQRHSWLRSSGAANFKCYLADCP